MPKQGWLAENELNPYKFQIRKEFMSNANLTSKGQTTTSKGIRDSLGLQSQDPSNFILMPDGTVIVRAKTCKLLEQAVHTCDHSPTNFGKCFFWRIACPSPALPVPT